MQTDSLKLCCACLLNKLNRKTSISPAGFLKNLKIHFNIINIEHRVWACLYSKLLFFLFPTWRQSEEPPDSRYRERVSAVEDRRVLVHTPVDLHSYWVARGVEMHVFKYQYVYLNCIPIAGNPCWPSPKHIQSVTLFNNIIELNLMHISTAFPLFLNLMLKNIVNKNICKLNL